MEYLFNCKVNKKHAKLEALIKENCMEQDMSRAAVLTRAIGAGKNVDWRYVQQQLLPKYMNRKKEEDIPTFTSYQARLQEETKALLDTIRRDMIEQLGLQRLQTQYCLLLLMTNFLHVLQEEKLKLKTNEIGDGEIELPEMARIFCEMMLTDKDSDEIKEIGKIMKKWRNK